MVAPYFYDTSANATPTNKEHLLTDLLDEIQNTLEEGLHTYCEEDPLGLKRHDISRSSLGYVRQTETITCVSVRIVANRDSIYRTEIERNEAKADLERIAETVASPVPSLPATLHVPLWTWCCTQRPTRTKSVPFLSSRLRFAFSRRPTTVRRNPPRKSCGTPSVEPEQGRPRSLRNASCGPTIGARNSRMGNTPTKFSVHL